MYLPVEVRLTRCESGIEEFATIETLTREAAKTEIDAQWWKSSFHPIGDLDDQPDSHWRWREIVSRYQNKPFWQAKCVRTSDGAIQAAMLFRVDALSAIESGQPAVFVDRLATAPRNREEVTMEPRFRGAGTGLLLFAIAQSYSLGYSGRVNLIPVSHTEFYVRKGFIPTGVGENDDVVFEVPVNEALRQLIQRGLIHG